MPWIEDAGRIAWLAIGFAAWVASLAGMAAIRQRAPARSAPATRVRFSIDLAMKMMGRLASGPYSRLDAYWVFDLAILPEIVMMMPRATSARLDLGWTFLGLPIRWQKGSDPGMVGGARLVDRSAPPSMCIADART